MLIFSDLNYESTFDLKMFIIGVGKRGLRLRALDSLASGPRFGSQHPHGGSEPSGTPVLGTSSSGLCGTRHSSCAPMQAKHAHFF